MYKFLLLKYPLTTVTGVLERVKEEIWWFVDSLMIGLGLELLNN
jgi:hypothetical protein